MDLTGKFLSASREVRIVTNMCVYWDQIYLSEDTAAPDARLTPMDADTADLRCAASREPWSTAARAARVLRLLPVEAGCDVEPDPGLYTRYGSVHELVRAVDDKFVVMGSGDEIRLGFDARGLPALAAGWRRDFLLLVDGWSKDADANTAFADRSSRCLSTA